MKFKDFVYPMDENLDFVHRYPLDEIIILSKNYDKLKFLWMKIQFSSNAWAKISIP